ncbi:engulfment and cell motility protein 1-like [Rhynchophorus ferrugineus]|uniref:engulfment and cell motility protein 1-like n=1 Tax=Rhynchophorus ferrugineus TaxID=354439 RepID=UPI003FCE3FF9
MSNIAKISVLGFKSTQQILYDFDKSLSLPENVVNVCKKTGLPESSVYGLKYHPTKQNPANNFITEDNYQEIKHSDCLEVVFCIKYIMDFIEANINSPTTLPIVFEYIEKHNTDPAFIKELAESKVAEMLIDFFITADLKLNDDMSVEKPLLITILHLFSKGYIVDTQKDILEKVLQILNNTDNDPKHYNYSLAILHKILCSKGDTFRQWKEKIVQTILIKDIMPYIWNNTDQDLHYSAVLLINTLIRTSHGEKKTRMIKEMNQSKNREHIYNRIIQKENLSRNMQHELYVLQTYILSLFSEAYKSDILVNDNSLFKREDFELCSEDLRRISILMEFEEENYGNQFYPLENLILNDGDRNSRISLSSSQSENTFRTASKRSSYRGYAENYNIENPTISHLTLEALNYYKKQHYRDFHQSQIEEKLYEPGIFITSEKVVKMLADIFDIGAQSPDSKSTFYQPIVFGSSRKLPFFFELFSRSMVLLSQTRRDMKVLTIADYPKMMNILYRQIKTALEAKPLNFTRLNEEMSNTSFHEVLKQIEKRKEEELLHLINTHPCIQELKAAFAVDNKKRIYQQRISCLQQGSKFPKVLEKKTSGVIHVQLSKNEQDLVVTEGDPSEANKAKPIKISDITHLVIGKNCQHSNLYNPKLTFSIVIDREEKVKFVGPDEKSAAYWIDAFILLMNKEILLQFLSTYYHDELKELVDMDVRLALLDLQGVKIPKHPPKIPPEPNTKPIPPPKPANISKRRLH